MLVLIQLFQFIGELSVPHYNKVENIIPVKYALLHLQFLDDLIRCLCLDLLFRDLGGAQRKVLEGLGVVFVEGLQVAKAILATCLRVGKVPVTF